MSFNAKLPLFIAGLSQSYKKQPYNRQASPMVDSTGIHHCTLEPTTMTEIVQALASICFCHGLDISRAMAFAPPYWWISEWHLTEQTRTDMSAMFYKHRTVVVKISRHYGVGHISVPCRPLFLYTYWLLRVKNNVYCKTQNSSETAIFQSISLDCINSLLTCFL